MGKIQKTLFVTATPRSGTKYAAHLWTALGLDIPHERVGADGTSSYYFLSPVIRFPTTNRGGLVHPGERYEDFEFKHTLHQTRHPLLTIASLQWLPSVLKIVRHHDPGGPPVGTHRLARTAAVYWMFNKLAEGIADYRYRVEDIDTELPGLCARVGIPYPGHTPPTPRDTNTKQKYSTGFNHEGIFWGTNEQRAARIDAFPLLTLSMLKLVLNKPWLYRLHDMAERYGYDLTTNPKAKP